jgi:hypothetical protein
MDQKTLPSGDILITDRESGRTITIEAPKAKKGKFEVCVERGYRMKQIDVLRRHFFSFLNRRLRRHPS